mmetsp:Transcript_22111/g.34012  ORF Transcript_22111/g.34012 Transcript_22111/m.34012 type:complete len:492 (-) Transcript_22111:249-1724(-)|eukprot:CAMPEP_0195308756 /NCGR_PEP_ID=MMETSP0707-20130614/38392_1 /TAXON_ID=33640 /ORGANISM="Asterionellopsis glacialis, Strain CCMP134" /LENGTH=491 /DNA_ID=CAMNT_0040373041 /DNA_START=112 /DNA_END=1587 /DNA_ORIENTATION=-
MQEFKIVDETQTAYPEAQEDDLSVASFEPAEDDGYSLTSSIGLGSLKAGLENSMDHWKILVFGQVLSLVLAGSGASLATLHVECGLSAPNFVIGLSYLVLCLFLVPLILHGRRLRNNNNKKKEDPESNQIKDPPKSHRQDPLDPELSSGGDNAPVYRLFGYIPIHAPAWAYFAVAVLDVEGMYMMCLAYKYTTLTSIMLLDALAVPSAMLFSYFILKRRYVPVHILGAGLCILGVSINVFADNSEHVKNIHKEEFGTSVQSINIASDITTSSSATGGDQFPYKVAGDMLAAMAAFLFGANDCFIEHIVRNYGGATEFLGTRGLFGAIIALTQAVLLESESIANFFRPKTDEELQAKGSCSVHEASMLLLIFVALNSFRYIGFSNFLLYSETALLNLSLLTGDLWAIMFSIRVEKIFPRPLFWIAVPLVMMGIFVYEMGPNPMASNDIRFDKSVDIKIKEGTPMSLGDNKQSKQQRTGLELSSPAGVQGKAT